MATTQSKTGRAGNITIAGTVIPITKWTATTTKELADSTDSNNYDNASGQLWKAQVPGAISQEVSIEFNYDLATTSTNVTNRIKNDSTIAVVLKIDAATTYCSGSYDMSEVETNLEVPGATMVTGSAKLMSNGIVTFP